MGDDGDHDKRTADGLAGWIADHLPHLVWTADEGGAVGFLGARWAAYTGVAVADQLATGWLGQVHGDDRAAADAAWAEAVAGGQPLRLEVRLRRHDGGYRWFEVRAERAADRRGHLTWFGTATDVDDERQRRAAAERQDSTDRKRAEAALLTADDRFTRAFRSGPAAISIVSATDGRILDVNDCFVALFGHDRAALQGRTAIEVGLETEAQLAARRAAMAARAAADGSVRGVEIEMTSRSGERKVCLASFDPVAVDDDPFRLWLLVDITERKAAERRLATQHAVSLALAEARSLAEAAPRLVRALCESEGWDFGAVWEVDAGAGVLHCVDLWHRPQLDAAPLAELTRRSTFAIGHGAPGRVWSSREASVIRDVHADDNFVRAAAAGGAGLRSAMAFPILIGDAVVGVVDVLATHIAPLSPQLVDLITSIGRQIGVFVERARAEAALRASEERLHAIVDHLTEGLVVADLGGQLLHWNPAALALHGFTSSTEWARALVEFRTVFRLESPDGEPVPFEDWPMARIARGERLRNLELRLCRLDHDWQRVFSYGGSLVDAPDGSRLIVLSMSDITERTRSAAELRMLNAELEHRVSARTAELEHANKELESFSYSVSHDLRAPLRALNGFAQIVLEDYGEQLPDEGRRLLAVVRDSGSRMGQLIDDLLGLARLGRKTVACRPVDMAAVVASALDEVRAGADDRRVEVSVDPLPPCQGDPSLLRQVWVNLLSNAFKYTRRRELARIEIGFEPSAEGGAYLVRDNGAGFDMAYAGKLFGVFQRLHRADEFEGTGVGLAIVQRIVQRHGGSLWAEAAPDRGATFRFTVGHGRGA